MYVSSDLRNTLTNRYQAWIQCDLSRYRIHEKCASILHLARIDGLFRIRHVSSSGYHINVSLELTASSQFVLGLTHL